MPDPQFEFDLRACEYDREGYYYPRWDRAKPITVTAATQQEAINTAARVLTPPRRGFYYRFKTDAIRPAMSASEAAR